MVEESRVTSQGIDYLDYAPRMVHIIEARQQKPPHDKPVDDTRAKGAATEFLLQGVSRDWLERAILKMFMQEDRHNTGTLNEEEFCQVLHNLDLGLTRGEIVYLLAEVEPAPGGNVAYQDFAPLCFDAVVTLVKDKFLEDPASLRIQDHQ